MNTPLTALPELINLTDQTAVVTGAAKGIGRGIALRLAEAGARVLAVDVDEVEGVHTARLITEAGGHAAFMEADTSSPGDARRVIARAVERWGSLDILVNNAGIFPPSPVLKTTPELWRKVMAVNLDGAFFLAQAAAAWMVDNGRTGSIINVASVDAVHPSGNLVHYDASKAGMMMMTRSMAAELGSLGIRVNAIAPGGIHTPGADAIMATYSKAAGISGEAMEQGFMARIPMKRMGEPDDIARAALFLASPMSSYVTGALLVVDGGYLVG